VDLAAYRIIQESLTNTIRHAGRPAPSCPWRGVTTVSAWKSATADEAHPRMTAPMERFRVQAMGSWECVSARSPRRDVRGGIVAGRGFAVHAELPLDGNA